MAKDSVNKIPDVHLMWYYNLKRYNKTEVLGFACEGVKMEGNLPSTALSAWTHNWVLTHKLSPAVLTTAVGRYHYPYFTAEEIEAQRS